MEVPEVQMKQNVYISKCKNLTINIPDKVKSISVGACDAMPCPAMPCHAPCAVRCVLWRWKLIGGGLFGSVVWWCADKCERVRVVFKAVVSTFEVVNSQRVYASCLEACPSFAIDKSSGVSVIVSRTALNQIPAPPEIVTSNISECNLVVPGATDDVDPVCVSVRVVWWGVCVRL